MATDGASSAALLYVLCALAALGVLADVILLVWQLMTYKLERGFRFVKGALILFDLFYALTGVAVILLLLYQDVAAVFLCKAGGFLILFATQEAVWTLATASVALLLWKRRSLSRDFQRRNVAIFALIVCAQGLVLLTISFLPFTNIHYFDNVAEYYFRCTPLRLPGEQGWAFSTLVLILNWIVIGVTVVALTIVSVRYSKCTEPELSPAGRLLEAVTPKKRLQRQIFLSLCIATVGWIITHVLVCASYFSGGHLDKRTVQWLLGFCISVCLSLHPLTFLVHSLLCKFVFPRYQQDPTGLKALLAASPRSLESVQRQHGGPQDPGIVSFLIRWRDRSGCQQTGSMKLFTPPTQEKWRNEVNAICRVGALSHPNVAPYLWVSPSNTFSAFLQSSIRLSLSKRSLLICRLHYPSGTLYSFLQNRIHQLTEIGLHKITLDVASGLEHIHQHHLVHNGLTTQSVFMASISEKIGLKAVIGDLENCYEVPANTGLPTKLPTAKPWTSGSQLPDLFSITGRIDMGSNLANNRFAPDIRSFGMVVLEMLMALTEYNQKKRPRLKVSSRATNDSRRSMSSMHSFDSIPQRSAMTEIKGTTSTCSSTDTDLELPTMGHPNKNHHHHHASGEPCTCSSNVTNVRAVKKGSKSKHNRYSFQLGSSNGSQIKTQSINSVPGGKQVGNDVVSLDSIDEMDLIEEVTEVTPHANRATYVNQVVANSEKWKKTRPWEIGPLQGASLQGSQGVSEESICPQSEYSPRSDSTTASSLEDGQRQKGTGPIHHKNLTSGYEAKLKPEVMPKPISLLCKPQTILPPMKSSRLPMEMDECTETETEYKLGLNGQASPCRRGSRTQIVTNGSFLTPRSTPEIRPPSRPRKADACTDTVDFAEYDSNESLPSVGLETAPPAMVDFDATPGETDKHVADQAAAKQFYSNGFQTIYEEEDGSKASLYKEVQNRKIQKLPITRRRLPPLPNGSEQRNGALTLSADIAKNKRNSMASLDESVVSFDSGVGSSCHYDMSDQSSLYFSNLPGTRQPFYVAELGQVDGEVYGPMNNFLNKRQTHKTQDSGIDSSADSCDEPSRHDSASAQDIHIKASVKPGSKSSTQESSEENVYEVVPDNTGKGLIVKKKKPCVGHHEGVGHSCCSINTNMDTLDGGERKRISTNSKIKEHGLRVDSTISAGVSLKDRAQSPRRSRHDLESIRKSRHESTTAVVNGKLSPSRQPSDKESKDAKANVEAQWKKLVDTATNTSDQDDSSIEEDQKLPSSSQDHTLEPEKRPAPLTTPVFTKLEAALLDELLDLRQQNNASRGAGAMLGEDQYGTYHHEACASHCVSCKRIYKRQCEVGGYLQPLSSRRRALNSNCNSFKLSSSSSSPSSLMHQSLSSVENLSSCSGEGSLASASTSRSGLGHRQVSHMKQLLHPKGLHMSGDNNQEMRRLLDGVQKTGNLGYIAGQLVPLLSECWTDDPVPTVDDILHKLCEVLPTAAV